MALFLMGYVAGDVQEGHQPIEAFGRKGPLRVENSSLRGDTAYPGQWVAFGPAARSLTKAH